MRCSHGREFWPRTAGSAPPAGAAWRPPCVATDANSAIEDDEERFDRDLAAELYITNGDTLDDAYHEHASPA